MSKINCNDIVMNWMTWDEIEPFKEQLIDMELNLMIKYHYPNWKISRNYPEQKVNELKQHLLDGNTFFMGAIYNNKLIGYYWAYTSQFIDKKRWEIRSLYVLEDYSNLGIGSKALEYGNKKAIEVGCDEEVTEYASWNVNAKKCYEKNGFETCRVEVIKELK